jgi:hypothetical protein
LEIYIKFTPTSGMTDVIVDVMVKVLCILSIATKEINQRRASELVLRNISIFSAYCSSEKFLKKLIGRTGKIKDALQRLEEATKEESWMATAESWMAATECLKAIREVGSRLPGVNDTGKNIGDKDINREQIVSFFIGVLMFMWLGAEKTALQGIGAGVTDGAQVIPNQSFTASS